MELIIDGKKIETGAGQSLLWAVRELGMDAEVLSERPIAAKIAGEVFNLNYIPVREKTFVLTGHPCVGPWPHPVAWYIFCGSQTPPAGRSMSEQPSS